MQNGNAVEVTQWRTASVRCKPKLRPADLVVSYVLSTGEIAQEPGRGPSLFTLDAMVDGQGQVQFLEMNCNPLVHPDLYAPMLQAWTSGAAAKPAEHIPALRFEEVAVARVGEPG